MSQAEAFRATLQRLNLSQREAARRLGLHWRTVHRYALGEAEIPSDIEERLERADQDATQ